MILSLVIRALQSPAKSAIRGVETSSSDFHQVFVFCVIGLLLTLCGILRFPELGAIIAHYNQF